MNTTAEKILDVAEIKTQMHGFNAFSYKDLQAEVGVKTSSIHYYFPTKQDLAVAMTERYTQRFLNNLTDLEKRRCGLKQLNGLSELYLSALKQGKFCLCGMLASDILSLSDLANTQLQIFFKSTENWITDAIQLAQQQDKVDQTLDSQLAARVFFSTLEGAMLIARTRNDVGYFRKVVQQAISYLSD